MKQTQAKGQHLERGNSVALDKEYTKALEGTLTEWLSAEDEASYRGL
jgi:hypothetical protein